MSSEDTLPGNVSTFSFGNSDVGEVFMECRLEMREPDL